jgi:hypothetical protein
MQNVAAPLKPGKDCWTYLNLFVELELDGLERVNLLLELLPEVADVKRFHFVNDDAE